MKLNLKERYSPIFFYTNCIPAVIDTIFLIISLLQFSLKYVFNEDVLVNSFADGLFFNRQIFYIDFYVFFAFFSLSLYGLLCNSMRKLYLPLLIMSLVTANLFLYTTTEVFTLKLPVFMAWCITVGMRFSFKRSSIALFIGIGSFLYAQFYPSVLGIVDMAQASKPLSINEIIGIAIILLVVSFFACIYRIIVQKLIESNETTKHLNVIMSQMTILNNRLQDFAKSRGQKAAEEERLRITRDMHDGLGYVFVNIVGLMEACISSKPMEWDKTKETFETVRNLASNGLQETRKTLRAIRDIQDPVETSLNALYEIKNIFESVTGISVEVVRNNMKTDYGRVVNKILIRTMQESLTNAVRHGKATQVTVYFFDDGNFLQMTVKDNGIGSKHIVQGIGLAGMEERLHAVGGLLETGSSAEGGFELVIKIPLVQVLMEEYGKTETVAG